MNYAPLDVADLRTKEEMVAAHRRRAKARAVQGRICTLNIHKPAPPKPVILQYQCDYTSAIQRAILTLSSTKLPIGYILDAIAKAHSVSLDELKGQGRTNRIVYARVHAVNLLTLHRPDLSLAQLGRALSRDHSTIFHGQKKLWPRVEPKIGPQMEKASALLGKMGR